jgi:hypothetical protein
MMNHLLRLACLFAIITSWAWSAETTGQWLKAELALIDLTISTDQGEQTHFYLNSRGDATIRLGDKEKRGTIKIAKDKAVIPFIDYIYQLPNEKAAETRNSAHIQRRIGDQTEHLIIYYQSAEDAKVLLKYIDALVKNLK